MFVVVIKIKRNDRMFFAKRPPPSKTRETIEHKIWISFASNFLNEIEYCIEGFFCPSIIRMNAGITAKFENSWFIAGIETSLLEDHHPFWFAKDVIVESAFWNSIFCWGLSEAHFLRDHGLNCLLEIMSGPGRCLQLQQVRVVS